VTQIKIGRAAFPHSEGIDLQEAPMFKHILLATDGSASSVHASRMAVDLARTHGAKLTALYVADPYPYIGIGELNPAGLQAYAAAGQQLAAQAHAHVDALCREGSVVALDVRLVEDVTAVSGIVQTAETLGVDLIVIGSNGRSGIERMVLGSVAAKVVAQSSVPVLVAR
jgi:nucleotide-binding universal stress UspA family protein